MTARVMQTARTWRRDVNLDGYVSSDGIVITELKLQQQPEMLRDLMKTALDRLVADPKDTD